MAKRIQARYDCTQLALYSICNTAWNNCMANLAAFAGYKSKYIPAYVTAKKAAITSASLLNDEQNREAAAELSRSRVLTLGATSTQNFQKLKGYIEDAFNRNEWKAQFEAAGQHYYNKATKKNWEYVLGLNSNMNAFITNNTAVLTATGGMPAGFPAQAALDRSSFATAYNTMMTQRETGPATGSKVDANNALYDDLQQMFKDARRGVFPDDAAMQQEFTFQYLKKLVTPKGSASLSVRLQRPDNTLVVDQEVTIQSETGTAIRLMTGANGEVLFDRIDPDRYRVTATVADYKPVDADKDVDTGVNARMTINLQPL
ncbi:MAG: carboxypeptidase-like regulatory domain-containing protein [Chitinophagales bacterium]